MPDSISDNTPGTSRTQASRYTATGMDKLDRILESIVAKGETPDKDHLLGAAFVVVNKDGECRGLGNDVLRGVF